MLVVVLRDQGHLRGKNYKNDLLTVIKFFVYMSAWDSLNDTFCNWYTEDLLILYLPIRLIKVYKHLVYVPQVYWCIAKTGSQKIRSLIYPPPKKIVFRKLNWLFICSVGRTNDHTLDITVPVNLLLLGSLRIRWLG